MSFDESSGNRDNNEGKSPSVHMGSLVDKKPQLKSQAEFWGQEYKGLKGIETVDKLLQTKQGHVKAAFNRPEIGDIDLVWGDSRGGLRHLTERRDEDYNRGKSRVNGKQMASLIPYILDRGGTLGLMISIIEGM
jgi:hypothetical protein